MLEEGDGDVMGIFGDGDKAEALVFEYYIALLYNKLEENTKAWPLSM